MTSSLHRTPLLAALHKQDAASTAVVNASGASFSYGTLLYDIARARHDLLNSMGDKPNLAGERIGFLMENGYNFVGKLYVCAPQ
jgi:malonyl-CoA/methylmalonyl-CoA synthetase